MIVVADTDYQSDRLPNPLGDKALGTLVRIGCGELRWEDPS